MSQSGPGKATPFRWVSVYFFGFFFVYSYFLPFWAPWLSSRGVNSEQIGLILGGSLAVRCLSNLVIATQLKNLLHVVSGLRALTLGMLISAIILFFCGTNIWLLALMTMVYSAFMAPAVPLSDVLAIRYASDKQLDYGKSRLWGSIGFLAGTAISGYVIDGIGPDGVLWMMIAGIIGTLLYAMKTPTPGLKLADAGSSAVQWPLKKVLADREVQWLLLVTSVLHGSHAAYYGFSVLYWQGQGVEASVIGYLWALGVVAEIILFNFSWWLLKRFNVKTMFAISAFGVIARWMIMGSTIQLEFLVLAQLLHAITFAACHVAVTRYIQDKPQQMAVPMQSLYNAISASAAIAVMTAITGFYFDEMQGGVFLGMAGMGVIALAIITRQPKPQPQGEAATQS